MAPTPKKFVAVRDFSVGDARFKTGDEVPNPSLALSNVLQFGDMFVEATNTRRKAGTDNESEAD